MTAHDRGEGGDARNRSHGRDDGGASGEDGPARVAELLRRSSRTLLVIGEQVAQRDVTREPRQYFHDYVVVEDSERGRARRSWKTLARHLDQEPELAVLLGVSTAAMPSTLKKKLARVGSVVVVPADPSAG